MTNRRRMYMTVVACIGWFALALQLYLVVVLNLTNGTSVATGVVQYFGYFTILTNILVALSLTAPLVAPTSTLGRLSSRPGPIAAVVVYIALVGLGYSTFLRALWNPAGWRLVADRLLHDVVPIAYAGYWLVFVPKGSLRWREIPQWLIYPIAYFVYAMIMGTFTAFYPYPFIDASVLGYFGALRNGMGFLAACLVLSALLITIDRLRSRQRQT